MITPHRIELAETSIYDGRIRVGVVHVVGDQFEAITLDGRSLGRFNNHRAAADELWRCHRSSRLQSTEAGA
jgi:hypothetical protein